MIELWMVITVVAAASQTARTAGQKHLATAMSSWSATWVRFLFGLPLAFGYFMWAKTDYGTLPPLNNTFLLFCFLTAIAQIIATVLLVYLFSLRNFAVGTTYARTEAFLTALVGSLFFAEVIDLAGWVAIAVSVFGVVLISMAKQGVSGLAMIQSALNRPAAIGVSSGLGFALSSLFLRKASLSFGIDAYLMTASMTLVTVVSMQTVLLGIYVLVTRRDELGAIARSWKACIFVGVTSFIGSAGWFTAMTLERASYVKALGQIEFLFALLVSTFIFREKSSRLELAGMAMVAAGVVVLIGFAK